MSLLGHTHSERVRVTVCSFSSMEIGGALVIGVDVRALPFDVRLAGGLGCKWAAADGIVRAYRVPAIKDTSLDAIDSLNVTCGKVFHQHAP
jgi:hypothetical protein